MGIASLRGGILDISIKVGDHVCGSGYRHGSHHTQHSLRAGVIARQTTDNGR